MRGARTESSLDVFGTKTYVFGDTILGISVGYFVFAVLKGLIIFRALHGS